jgi:chromodomain-helicase-DNA-binding protein 7
LEPDRILSCAELFPLVHPKKGGELKGRWCDLLQLCISKMLNFSKSKVKYGVYFMEPVNPDKDGCPNYKKEITHPMDLGTINNRIYLGCYKDSA